MELKDKVIIISGASTGIGADLLQALLEEGAYVYGVSRNIEAQNFPDHERLKVKNLDVANVKNIDWLFNDAIDAFGSIDLFIANAGFTYYEMLDKANVKHIDDIYNVNTRSVIYSAVKMRELYRDKPFRFMATLSAVSYISMPGYALYSSTKAALHSFFKSFRLELKRPDQLIHTVYPVATKTPFFKKANQERKPWPVQETHHVVKSIIKGLKKDKEKIYPSKLFKYSYAIMPWFYRFYIKRETKAFHDIMQKHL